MPFIEKHGFDLCLFARARVTRGAPWGEATLGEALDPWPLLAPQSQYPIQPREHFESGHIILYYIIILYTPLLPPSPISAIIKAERALLLHLMHIFVQNRPDATLCNCGYIATANAPNCKTLPLHPRAERNRSFRSTWPAKLARERPPSPTCTRTSKRVRSTDAQARAMRVPSKQEPGK